MACILTVPTLSAQEKFTRVEIVTDTTETTRKLLSQMDNQTFSQWVNSVSLNAELQQFDFKAPPLAQFSDSFHLKINISDFRDTTHISIQLMRKSVADRSKVLAKISFASSLVDEKTKVSRDSSIVASHQKQEQADSSYWEFQKSRKNKDSSWTVYPPLSAVKSDSNLPPNAPEKPKKRKKKHSVYYGPQTIVNLNAGLLQMQDFNSNIPRTTVMRYDEMPALSNAHTQNWGVEILRGINLYKGAFRLWYGLSYESNIYRFNADIRIDPNVERFNYRFADPNDPNEKNTKRSNLYTEYIGIPLALGYQNNGFSKWRFLVGIQGGYLMNAYTTVRYYDDRKVKNYDDFNMNDLMLQPFVRIQWDQIALYGKYSMLGVFKPEQGADQKNMVLGISLCID